MLAPEEISSLRAVALASLGGVCDITRKIRVRQPNGSWKDVPSVVASGVPCRKVPTGQTPAEVALLQGTTLAERGVSTFILGGGQSIFKDDVLVYPAGAGGKTYGVIGVYSRTAGEYLRAMVYDDSASPSEP